MFRIKSGDVAVTVGKLRHLEIMTMVLGHTGGGACYKNCVAAVLDACTTIAANLDKDTEIKIAGCAYSQYTLLLFRCCCARVCYVTAEFRGTAGKIKN